MPLITGDFVVRLSGGSTNAVGSASLGGVRSGNAASTSIDALFDGVASDEASAGRTEYRCVYLYNGNGSSQMLSTVAWISANTPSTGTTLAIGVGSSAVNGTEQTVASETTAPTGVTFTEPASQGTGIALGDIPAGQHRAIWLRRTVSAATPASPEDTFTLSFYADFTS